jgi:hypothetical protein
MERGEEFMSKQIDERIVQMTFENRAFEQGIQNSINSLKNLDQSINSLDKSGKTTFKVAFDASGLTNTLDMINHRLSATGIIGAKVLGNLTDSAMNFATKGIGGVFNQIKEGGKKRATSIENAKFQLMGLLKDTAKVNQILSDANESVTGTAYGYDQAAKAASMFAASGVQGGEQMLNTLQAIAGVSAQANADYDSIAHIFTTIAGNGRVMSMQLNQLSIHGLNAAATLADYMDSVKSNSVTASAEVRASVDAIVKKFGTGEAAIRSAVSEGMVSFDMFSSAMKEAFGEHAYEANKTFSGSFANMMAALSRVGQKFYQPLIQSGIDGMQAQSEIITLFNSIKNKINEVNKYLDPLAELVTGKILDAAHKLSTWIDHLYVAPIIDEFYRWIEVFKGIGDIGVNSFMSLKSIIEPVGRAIKDVWVSLGIHVVENVQNIVNKIKDFTESLRASISLQANIRNFFENILYGMLNVGRQIKFILGGFINLIKNSGIFQATFKGVGKILGFLLGIIEKFFILLQKIDLRGFSSQLSGLSKSIEMGLTKGLQKACDALNAFLGFLGVEGRCLIEKMDTIGNALSHPFEKIANSDLLENIKNKFKKNIDESTEVVETFEKELPKLESNIDKIQVKTLTMGQAIEESTRQGGNLAFLKDRVRDSIDKVKPVMEAAIDNVDVMLNGAFGEGFLRKTIDTIKQTYSDSGVIGVLKLFGLKLIEVGKTIMGKVTEFMQTPEFKAFREIFLTLNFVKIMKDISKWGGLLGKNPLFNNQMFGNFNNGKKQNITNAKSISTALLELAGAVLVLTAAVKVLSTIEDPDRLLHTMEAFSVLMVEVGGITTTLGLLGKNFENSKRSALILVALAASLFLACSGLAKLAVVENNNGQIIDAMVALSGVIATVGTVIVALNKLTQGEEAKNLIGSSKGSVLALIAGILVIGHAISSMGKALAKLANNDPEAIMVAGVTLAGIVAVFVKISAMWASVNLKPTQILTLASTLYILSGSFAILAVSLLAVSLIPFDKMEVGLQVMAGLLIGISAVATVIGMLGTGIAKGATAFAAFAISLAIIAVVIKKLSEMEKPEVAVGVMVGMAAIFLAFGGILKILDGVNLKKVKWKPIIAMAAGLTLVMAAIGGLSKVVKECGYLNMLGAMSILALVLAAFAGLLWLLDKKIKLSNGAAWTKFSKLGVAIRELSVSMVALAAACAIFAKVPWNGIGKAGVVLGSLVAVFAGFAVAAKVLGGEYLVYAAHAFTAIGKSVLMFGAGLALTAASIMAFGIALMFVSATAIPTLYLGLQSLKVFVEGLCDILIELGPKLREAVAELIVIAIGGIIDAWPRVKEAALQAILQVIQLLDEYSPQIVDALSSWLCHTIDQLSTHIPEILQSVYRFLDALAGNMRNPGGNFVTKVLLEIAGIGLIVTALGKIPGSAVAALKGLVVLAEVIGGLTVILMAAGAIASIPGVLWLMDKGGELFGSIGNAIGQLLGGLIGGQGEQMAKSFVSISEDLSKGMDKLQPFLDSVKDIDENTMKGIRSLCSAMLMMSTAELLKGIKNMLGVFGIGTNFSSMMDDFGEGFDKFYDHVKDIKDTKAVKNVCKALEYLVEACAKIPNSGGLAGLIFGENDIDDFGGQLLRFGNWFKKFYDTMMEGDFLKNLDPALIQPLKDIIDVMATAAKAIPNSGGLLGEWVGNNDLDMFAQQMAAAAPDIMEFCKTVENITEKQVKAAKMAVSAIAGMTEVAGNIKGDASAAAFSPYGLFGIMLKQESGMTTLAKQLPVVGDAIAKFANEVDGIDASSVTGAANATKILSETLIGLSGAGIHGFNILNVFSWFKDNGLKKLGDQLPSLGKDIKKFAKQVKDVDPSTIGAVASVVQSLANVLTVLQKVDEGRKFFRNDTNLVDFGKQLEKFGGSFKDFYKKISKVDLSATMKFAKCVERVVNAASAYSNIGSGSLVNLAEEFSEFAYRLSVNLKESFEVSPENITDITDSFSKLFDRIKYTLQTGLYSFTNYITTQISNGLKPSNFKSIAYKNIVLQLCLGMTNSNATTSVRNATTKLGTLIRNGLNSYSNPMAFRTTGSNIVGGLVSGILSSRSQSLVSSASTKIASGVQSAMERRLQIHSPSRVTERIGMFSGEGLANGVIKMAGSVKNAAVQVCDTAVDTMRANLARVADTINGDIDMSPRITPILDLDQLRNSADQINGMFGETTFKMAAESNEMANQLAIANANAAKAMSIDDTNMVNAISDLRRDVNVMGKQMSNLQVVMDSGALVGQIASPMDSVLGNRLIRREREA